MPRALPEPAGAGNVTGPGALPEWLGALGWHRRVPVGCPGSAVCMKKGGWRVPKVEAWVSRRLVARAAKRCGGRTCGGRRNKGGCSSG
jgi:hypothetical protein